MVQVGCGSVGLIRTASCALAEPIWPGAITRTNNKNERLDGTAFMVTSLVPRRMHGHGALPRVGTAAKTGLAGGKCETAWLGTRNGELPAVSLPANAPT